MSTSDAVVDLQNSVPSLSRKTTEPPLSPAATTSKPNGEHVHAAAGNTCARFERHSGNLSRWFVKASVPHKGMVLVPKPDMVVEGT